MVDYCIVGAENLGLVCNFKVTTVCAIFHFISFQIDSPALLANVLVSATNNSEEIESADVSLIVGLLDTITNSPEDLQQESVSAWSL